jgi:hypothetical protein
MSEKPKFRKRSTMTSESSGAYEATKQNESTSSISCTIETTEPDDIFSSEINKREKSSPCDEADFSCRRLTNNSVSAGEMPNFGEIINDDIYVEMDYGSWAPGIQNNLLNGTTIKTITIRRVMNIKNEIEDVQVVICSSCLFKTYEQVGKRIIFSFSWETREDKNLARQRDGTLLGQYSVFYDSAASQAKYNGG